MTHRTRRSFLCLMLAAGAAGCAGQPADSAAKPPAPGGPAQINQLIEDIASRNNVPSSLVHRVVRRESGYRPEARNGPYYGLMQIHPQTARTMGHRGPASELLVARTNLEWGVKYLRGAWLVSGGDADAAVGWYARGYYYEAKRLGLLKETGLR